MTGAANSRKLSSVHKIILWRREAVRTLFDSY
jgi:hypothetical protein